MSTQKSTKIPLSRIVVNPDDSVDFVVTKPVTSSQKNKLVEINNRLNNPSTLDDYSYLQPKSSEIRHAILEHAIRDGEVLHHSGPSVRRDRKLQALKDVAERFELGPKQIKLWGKVYDDAIKSTLKASRHSNPQKKKNYIGTDGTWEYWTRDRENVYRNKVNDRGPMYDGVPNNARWESTIEHFNRFKRSTLINTQRSNPAIKSHVSKQDLAELYNLAKRKSSEYYYDDTVEYSDGDTYRRILVRNYFTHHPGLYVADKRLVEKYISKGWRVGYKSNRVKNPSNFSVGDRVVRNYIKFKQWKVTTPESKKWNHGEIVAVTKSSAGKLAYRVLFDDGRTSLYLPSELLPESKSRKNPSYSYYEVFYDNGRSKIFDTKDTALYFALDNINSTVYGVMDDAKRVRIVKVNPGKKASYSKA